MRVLTWAERAEEFARCYVALVEALLQQGAPDEVARNEARVAAITLLSEHTEHGARPQYDPARGPCPTCHRG